MTAVLAAKQPGAARDAAAIGHALAHGLTWVWHSDATVVAAVVHHQVPPAAPDAAFAVTFVAVLAIVFRKRRRPAGA